jgi:sugar-phosphatase
MREIEAAIFDMDGLLLDSEPFWQEAEMRVFRTIGIELTLEQCLEFTGIPIGEVVAQRFRERPWPARMPDEIVDEIIDGVEDLVRERGEPLAGARDTLEFVRRKGVRLALASSSAMRLIRTVTERLGLANAFAVMHSAEVEAQGKPHPAVFLSTARRLGVDPESCVVFEDSFNGLLAAQAARMRAVVVPAAREFEDVRFDRAELKLRTLSGFGDREWEQLIKGSAVSAR